MAKKRPITVWYDREGDFLEVLFEHVIGFHVQHATRLTQPLDLELAG